MIIIKDPQQLKGIPLVATVGFFDGVHLGHRFLIRQMKESAAHRPFKTAVITFAHHPRVVLQKDYQPKLLNSFEEKLAHLEETGVDYCVVLDFTLEFSRLSAREFICGFLAEQLNVKMLYVGYDHRFGRNREETMDQYTQYGAMCGIEVLQAPHYDAGKHPVSSSEIRRLLQHGNVEDAAALLSYPYLIRGSIVAGFKVGRKLGFPTANIQVDEPYKVIPAIGVYAVKVCVREKSYDGMLYIGNRPTLNNGKNVTLEVNIFDFAEDIYHCAISVSFIRYIRGDVKFDSLDALKEQLALDRQKVVKIMNDPL